MVLSTECRAGQEARDTAALNLWHESQLEFNTGSVEDDDTYKTTQMRTKRKLTRVRAATEDTCPERHQAPSLEIQCFSGSATRRDLPLPAFERL